MNKDTGVGVCRRLLASSFVAAMVASGCTPRHISWIDTYATIEPQVVAGDAPQSGRGYLAIAMQHLGEPSDEDMEHYPPVYLYDHDGHFLSQLPNNTEHPIALPPAQYIVLVGETDPLGEFHQVQVDVVHGETTTVNLADIQHAPQFWAMSRDLSN